MNLLWGRSNGSVGYFDGLSDPYSASVTAAGDLAEISETAEGACGVHSSGSAGSSGVGAGGEESKVMPFYGVSHAGADAHRNMVCFCAFVLICILSMPVCAFARVCLCATP
jgi:hypothetical protein